MIYKVIRGFTDRRTGERYKTGTYVEIKDDRLLEIRTRIRRRNLLLARDQEGARKLVGVADPRRYHHAQKEEEKKQKGQRKKVKNAKTTQK